MNNSYPAKLLLFGEHTVNLGSQALAIPLTAFSGSWQWADPNKMAMLQNQLPLFVTYLLELQQIGSLPEALDIKRFREEVNEGLQFSSNIPLGYGTGSSGALVAGIYDRYATHKTTDLVELRRILAQMEGYFHGKSSGTDPLVCYVQEPLLLGKNGHVEKVCITPMQPPYTLFLLDTGIRRQATPLIEYFLQRYAEPSFRHLCHQLLIPAADLAIEAFAGGNGQSVFRQIHEIGAFQRSNLDRLVPVGFREIWDTGLESDLFKLKVCGAGGGGFILGITQDFEALQIQFPEYKLLSIDH